MLIRVGVVYKTLRSEGHAPSGHDDAIRAKTTNDFVDKDESFTYQTFGKTFGSSYVPAPDGVRLGISAWVHCQKFCPSRWFRDPSYSPPQIYDFQKFLLCSALPRKTSPNMIGTSQNRPIVVPSAAYEPTPYIATAAAMAISK